MAYAEIAKAEWPDRGACRTEILSNLWISDLKVDQEKAAGYCKSLCPVTNYCLEYAIRKGERWGVWGGCTPDERRQLARGN